MAPVVELRGLGKKFGAFTAVRDLDLTVGSGEILALLGPNGAGKTTTIRMLMGILQPTSGEVRIRGMDCFAERAAVMRHVGYVPDTPIFYDYLTGREILRFVGEMHGFGGAEVQERCNDLTNRLALDEALDEFAVNYSKGMQKKLAVVCAMLHDPSVLILDEPTSGLDPYATRTLHELIRTKAEEGCSVVFSTHLLDQAERLCHRAGIIFKGRLVAVGKLDELRADLAPDSSLEEIFFSVTEDGEA